MRRFRARNESDGHGSSISRERSRSFGGHRLSCIECGHDGPTPERATLAISRELMVEDGMRMLPPTIDDEVAALRAIVEGTARSTGAVFFESLVKHLASTLGVSFA